VDSTESIDSGRRFRFTTLLYEAAEKNFLPAAQKDPQARRMKNSVG
jgi:hypothetical protein